MASIDYGNILKRSFEITKRNKWLWVYGLALAIFGGGSGNGGGGGGNGGGNNIKIDPDKLKNLPQDLPEKTSYILGEATNALKDWVSHVPIYMWLLLGLGIVLLILFSIIVTLIVKNWAKGALIAGLADADRSKPVTLLSTSPKGIASFKHLFILSLISLGITLATIFVVAVVVIVGYLLFSLFDSRTLQIIWLVLTLSLGGLSFIIFFILLAMISIYAERLIVLKSMRPWEAWKKGLNISKGNFFSTLIMGIINSLIGCSVGCLGTLVLVIILGIPAVFIAIIEFRDGLHFPSFASLAGFFLIFMLFIYASWLIKAILTVFNFSNWHLFFKEIYSTYEK